MSPTAKPFAYNPTQVPISGATQCGDIAVLTGTTLPSVSGITWWNGPDEDNRYII